jgi:hypothetical protein
MVMNKEIRSELQQKFPGLSTRRVDQIIIETQKKYRIVDRDTAGYVLAFEKDIKLTKHLEQNEVKKIQDAMQNGPKIIEIGKSKQSKEKVVVPYVIKIGKEFEIDHPILPKRIIDEAIKMSEIYPVIYAFENSVRKMVQTVMQKNHNTNWWDNKVSRKIRDKVSERMKDEERNRWHGKRGAHEVFYSDIEDLSDIISTNWKDFESFFPNQHWVKTMIEIIGKSRNVIAHNNPLSDDDMAALKVHFKQWTNQIKDFGMDEP